MRGQILSPKLKKAQVHYITQFTSKKSLKKGIVGLIVGLGLLGTTQLAQADTVKVKPGDTLSEIAQVHHDTVAHLEKVNQLKDVAVIFPGDTLVTGKTNPKKAKVTDPLKPIENPVQHFNQSQEQLHYEAPKQAQTASQSVTQVSQQPAPVKQDTPAPQPQAQSQNTQGGSSAEDSIIYDESRGQAGVSNGRYYGLYGMDVSRLHGDYSVANQRAVAQQYMQERYGTWERAREFHNAHNFW